MTQDKAIKICHPDMPLPPDLSRSNKQLDDYLSTLKQSSEMSQRKLIRYEKMAKTRQQNVITQTEEKKAVFCKQEVVLEDSSIIVEKRVGYKLTCPRCMNQWIWHGRKDRFFVSCSRCHKSFKLNWK